MNSKLALLSFVVILVLVAVPASAQSTILVPLLANDLLINTAPPGTSAAAVAFDGNNYLVAWAQGSVYGRFISTSGAFSGSAFPISQGGGTRVEVAYNGSHYLVVWESNVAGIYKARVVDTNGTLLGSEISIVDAHYGNGGLGVASDGIGFLIVWADGRTFSTTNGDIYGQRVSVDGAGIATLDGSNFLISPTAGHQFFTSVAFGDSSYLVTWTHDPVLNSGQFDVYGALVDASANVSAPIAISTAASSQGSREAGIAFDGNNFLVVFDDSRDGTDNIFGSRVSGTGVLIDGPASTGGIPISLNPGFCGPHQPKVAFSGVEWLVVWSCHQTRGARVSSAGAVLDSTGFNLFVTYVGSQFNPRVAFDGTNYLVTWSMLGGTWDKYAQLIGTQASNSSPVAEDDNYPTNEDAALNVAAPGVLGNDMDSDGDALTAVLDNTTTNGSLTLHSDGSFIYLPNANYCGTDSFIYHAEDGLSSSDNAIATITIECVNDPPVANDDTALTDENVFVDIEVLANDNDVDGHMLSVTSVTQGSNGAVTINPDNTVRYSPNAGFSGLDSFTYTASDGNGGSATAVVGVSVTPANNPPTADAGGPYEVDEGSSIVITASGIDPDNDSLTFAWDLDYNGSFETPGQSVNFSAAGLDGPSSHTIAVQVTDSGGLTATDLATVNVLNVAPIAGTITAPLSPVQVNTAINTSSNFTDPGTLDTHVAVWDWGDNTTSAGTVDETNGSGTVTGSHTYSTPGVFTVTVTVTDDDGWSDQSTFQYVVAYDPDGGFVTGGGWIDSPEGAYVSYPSMVGKANFGFVSKYKKGASVPTGVTEFQFKAADLNFRSEIYEWLVVAGAKAQFKGTGTINDEGQYKFLLQAIDADVNSNDSFSVDRFRIKIWSEDTNGNQSVIYDNGLGAADDDDNATTEIGGGSIVIHNK